MRTVLTELVRLILLILFLPLILIIIGPLLIWTVLRGRQPVGPIVLNTSRYSPIGRAGALILGLLLWLLVWGGLIWLGMAASLPPATVAQVPPTMTATAPLSPSTPLPPTFTATRVSPVTRPSSTAASPSTPTPPPTRTALPPATASPTLTPTLALVVTPTRTATPPVTASPTLTSILAPVATPTRPPTVPPVTASSTLTAPASPTSPVAEPTATLTLPPTLGPTQAPGANQPPVTVTPAPPVTPLPTLTTTELQAAVAAVEAGNSLLHEAMSLANEENMQNLETVWQGRALIAARDFATRIYDQYAKPLKIQFEYLTLPTLSRRNSLNQIVITSQERWTYGGPTKSDYQEAFRFVYILSRRGERWMITDYSYFNLPLATPTPGPTPTP